MQATKYWAKAIFGDLLIFGLFWLWLFHHIDGAGNALIFLLWLVCFARFVVAFFGDKTVFKDPRPAGFRIYHIITETAVAVALSWNGYYILPALLLFAATGVEAARRRDPKKKPEEADNNAV